VFSYYPFFGSKGKSVAEVGKDGVSRADTLSPTNEEIIINAKEFSPGMYLYNLVVDGNEVDVKRMILTK